MNAGPTLDANQDILIVNLAIDASQYRYHLVGRFNLTPS